MNTSDKTKKMVQQKYSEIATKNQTAGCCDGGCSCGDGVDYSIMSDDYSKVEGHFADADLKLGCGVPTEHAEIKPGNRVLDLGCGAGNDVFVARQIVGETGHVIGIDMTETMLLKAGINNEKLGYENVEFRLGDIENMPVEDNYIDVTISNCVLNLVPDKEKAFSEIFRTLKPGAHFCVSDIVIEGELPEKIKKSAEMYAGCVAGAVQKDDYLNIIKNTGFKNIEIRTAKEIKVPRDILLDFMSKEDIFEFRNSGIGIKSITVYGQK